METLTSLRNPALREIRKAIARGSTTERGFCVAEGFHLLKEALRSGCCVDAVFATQAAAERLRGDESARTAILPDEVFRSIVTTETSQGIVTLVKPPVWTMKDLFRGQALILILDGVQDPGNAGAMLRAAEAFGATGVALLKGSANPYSPKALRASAGSTFRVPLLAAAAETEVLDAVERHGAALFALMPSGGGSVSECALDQPCGIVAGSEGRGVGEMARTRAIHLRIPTIGVESLNAAMAATVVLYEARKQRMAVSR